MGAIIKQYEGSSVSPKDDAVMHEIFNAQSGVIRGCEITYLGSNQIRVGEGYMYICGREIQIEEETVLSFFSETEAEGELILKIDLLSETPAKLLARTPRIELTKGDINGGDSVYEYLLASYTVSDVSISGLTIEYDVISAGFSENKILSTMEEVEAVTEPGFLVDALVISEQNKKLSSGEATFNLDYQNNQWGWNEDPARGADTFHPFLNLEGAEPNTQGNVSTTSFEAEIGKKYFLSFYVMANYDTWSPTPSGCTIISKSAKSIGPKNAGFYVQGISMIVQATSTTISCGVGVYGGMSWIKIS